MASVCTHTHTHTHTHIQAHAHKCIGMNKSNTAVQRIQSFAGRRCKMWKCERKCKNDTNDL